MKTFNFLAALCALAFFISCAEKPTEPTFIKINFKIKTYSADFSCRFGHSSLVFDNKLWVLGGTPFTGIAYNVYFNDVWYSRDGMRWTKATDSAWSSGRYGHTSLVFNNKLWVIGGLNNLGQCNEIWYSDSGKNWSKIPDSIGFQSRLFPSSVVFQNKMWIIGGYSGLVDTTWYFGGEPVYDIWNSADGASWTKVIDTIPIGKGRVVSSAVVFNNKIWVISCLRYSSNANDVWYSSDGISWVKAASSINLGCDHQTMTVYNNKIFVIGGYYGYLSNLVNNDVFYSENGSHWLKADCINSITPGRWCHTTVEFNGLLWIIAGCIYTMPGAINDVWNTEL